MGGGGRRSLEDRGTGVSAAAQAEDEVQGALLGDVVVGEGAVGLELLAGEDEALLVWGDALLVLDLDLDALDGVGGLNVQGDGLADEGAYEYLHHFAEG